MEDIVKFIAVILPGFIHGTMYNVSNEMGTSETAAGLCRLATPNIVYDRDGPIVELNMDDIEGVTGSIDMLWIGYAQIYAAFLYIGCSEPGDVTGTGKYENMPKDPGQCYSRCNTPFVGIEEKMCYCMSEVQESMLQSDECDRACSFSDKTLCGKTNKGISVYKKDEPYLVPKELRMKQTTVKQAEILLKIYYDFDSVTYRRGKLGENDDVKACRALEPTQGDFLWAECSNHYEYLCQTGSYKSPGNYVFGTDFKDWDKIMRDCLSDGHYPAEERINNVPNTTQGESQRWIGIIRTFTIIKSIDGTGNEAGFRQGYIRRDKGQYRLEFGFMEDELRGLCSSMPTITSTTTEIPDLTTIANTGTTKNGYDGGADRQRSSENKGLVAVYVVVPLLIITAAVVITVFIWRKRHQAQTTHTEKLERGTGQSTPGTAITNLAYDDTIKESKSTDNTDMGHDYFVLENANEYAVIKDTEVDESCQNEYDTTGSGRSRPNGAAEGSHNVYSHLENATDEPYNHINIDKSMRDETYNHVTGDASYETAGAVKPANINPARATENENDTYNHIRHGDLPK